MTSSGDQLAGRAFQARVGRSLSNKIELKFVESGAPEPFATAEQNAGGGVGAKMGVLFGFKNGGTGSHGLTVGDRTLGVVSKDGAPTEITDGIGGTLVARVERGATSTAVDANGQPLVRFVPRPPEPRSPDLFSMELQTPDGRPVGTLDIVRHAKGWGLLESFQKTLTFLYFLDHAGAPLKFPFQGAQVMLTQPLDGLALDAVLAACVDIVIGLRPYIAEMN